MRSIKVAASLCALALGAASCASSDGSAHNQRWARSFCASLDTWQRSTTSSSEALEEYLKTPNLDPTTAKARLTKYLHDASESTDRLVRGLGKAGAPAIEAARKVERTLGKGSTAVRSAIADAATVVDALPVDNGEQFKLGIEAANARLSKGFASFGDALDRINRVDAGGDLIKAERSVAACRPLLS
jgi:hypothetical protein